MCIHHLDGVVAIIWVERMLRHLPHVLRSRYIECSTLTCTHPSKTKPYPPILRQNLSLETSKSRSARLMARVGRSVGLENRNPTPTASLVYVITALQTCQTHYVIKHNIHVSHHLTARKGKGGWASVMCKEREARGVPQSLQKVVSTWA